MCFKAGMKKEGTNYCPHGNDSYHDGSKGEQNYLRLSENLSKLLFLTVFLNAFYKRSSFELKLSNLLSTSLNTLDLCGNPVKYIKLSILKNVFPLPIKVLVGYIPISSN